MSLRLSLMPPLRLIVRPGRMPVDIAMPTVTVMEQGMMTSRKIATQTDILAGVRTTISTAADGAATLHVPSASAAP